MNVAKYLTDSEEEDVLSDQEKQQKHNLSPQKGPKRLDDDLTILSRNDQQYDSAEEGSDDQAAERVSISGKVSKAFSSVLMHSELTLQVAL